MVLHPKYLIPLCNIQCQTQSYCTAQPSRNLRSGWFISQQALQIGPFLHIWRFFRCWLRKYPAGRTPADKKLENYHPRVQMQSKHYAFLPEGHVFAKVVARALNNCFAASISYSESLADAAVQENLTARGAIKASVTLGAPSQ